MELLWWICDGQEDTSQRWWLVHTFWTSGWSHAREPSIAQCFQVKDLLSIEWESFGIVRSSPICSFKSLLCNTEKNSNKMSSNWPLVVQRIAWKVVNVSLGVSKFVQQREREGFRSVVNTKRKKRRKEQKNGIFTSTTRDCFATTIPRTVSVQTSC